MPALSWQADLWCAYSAPALREILTFLGIGGLTWALKRWRDLGKLPPRPQREIAAWMALTRRSRRTRRILLVLCGLLAALVAVHVALYVSVGDVRCGREVPRSTQTLLTVWAGLAVGTIVMFAAAAASGLRHESTTG